MVKIGINGFGRIGRLVARILGTTAHKKLKLAAVNSQAAIYDLAHLLKYDSVHRTFEGTIEYNDTFLIIEGKKVRVTRFNLPQEIPWGKLGIDIVLETTGKFTNYNNSYGHLDAGAKKVIISAPGKNIDATFVMGVNHKTYNPEKHHIISNASCTTNCLAPVAKVLNDAFGFKNGFMTTIHSYTMNQRILDGSHKDIRRARAAAMSIIPTSSGAAQGVIQVIPTLKEKLNGLAIRVPTPNVSLVDLTCLLDSNITRVEEINEAFKQASLKELKGILKITNIPLVSIDYTSSSFSSIVDAPLTQIINGQLVKVIAWYDNEMGFTHRLIELASYIASKF